MKIKYLVLVAIFFLSSCEKSVDEPDTILKYYGDAFEDIGYSIVEVGDGYVITGEMTEIVRNGRIIDVEHSEKRTGIIKTDINGNTIWERFFGDTLVAGGSKIIQVTGGSLICIGYILDPETSQSDIFVIKIAGDTSSVVQKIYKLEGNQYGIDVLETGQGFVILGTTDVERQPLTEDTGNEAGKSDIFILQVDNDLNEIATPVAVGFPGNDDAVAIKHDIGGGFIIVGTTERSDLSSEFQSGHNILIVKVNADGSTTDPRIIGGTEDEFASDLELLDDGYLIVGTIGKESSNPVGYVWKLSDNIYGEPVFDHEIVLETSSLAKLYYTINSLAKYKTSSFVIAGQAGTGSAVEMLIFVLDANGFPVDNKIKITGGTGIQVAYDVISDSSDNIIAVGKNSYGEKNSLISLLKFRF